MARILTLHPTSTTISPSRPARTFVPPADFDFAPSAVRPYIVDGLDVFLHELADGRPVRTWEWVRGGAFWSNPWGPESDHCVRSAVRRCARGCRCARHSVDGVAWPLRREVLDAHASAGVLDVGVVRWEFEVDAGLRHDDEVDHTRPPSPGKTWCFYCEARAAAFSAAV